MTGPLCGVVETHKYEQAHSSVQARPWGFNLHPAHPHHIASSSLANKSERRRRRGTQAAQGELRCVRAHAFVCVCGGGYWFPDSRTSASECRVSRSPARKNKSQSWSDGCGTLGSGARAIWMAETVYQLHAQQIKFTFGRLPRHRCNRKRPHRPSSLNGFDLSFLGLLCKDDVDPCAVCQHNVTVAIKSHYMQPNGC